MREEFNCPSAEEAIQQRHCNFVIRYANTNNLLCSVLSSCCRMPVLFTVCYLIILLFNLDFHYYLFYHILVNKVACVTV